MHAVGWGRYIPYTSTERRSHLFRVSVSGVPASAFRLPGYRAGFRFRITACSRITHAASTHLLTDVHPPRGVSYVPSGRSGVRWDGVRWSGVGCIILELIKRVYSYTNHHLHQHHHHRSPEAPVDSVPTRHNLTQRNTTYTTEPCGTHPSTPVPLTPESP